MKNAFTSNFGGGGGDATKLPLTGGTLTGGLTLSSGAIRVNTLSSATTPAFGFTDSGTTGWYSPSNGIAYYGGASRGIPFGLGRNGIVGTVQIGYSGRIEFCTNAADSGTLDLFVGRDAAASLQLGVNHATTATNQTIKAHNVTTGTGADLCLKGGTGSVANGVVSFGVRSAIGAETITGFITIKDEGGTLRKLAVVS